MENLVFGTRHVETVNFGPEMPQETPEGVESMADEPKSRQNAIVRDAEPSLAEVLTPDLITREDFKNRQALLTEQLQAAYLSGSVEDIMRTEAEIRSLPIRQRAAEIAQTTRAIKAVNERLQELEKEVAEGDLDFHELQKIMFEKQMELEPYQKAVTTAWLAVEALRNQKANHIVDRRELQRKLKSYVAETVGGGK